MKLEEDEYYSEILDSMLDEITDETLVGSFFGLWWG